MMVASCPTAQPSCGLTNSAAVSSSSVPVGTDLQVTPWSSDSSTVPRSPAATSRSPARAMASSTPWVCRQSWVLVLDAAEGDTARAGWQRAAMDRHKTAPRTAAPGRRKRTG